MKPWIKFSFIFLIGLLLGVAGTGIYIHRHFSRAFAPGDYHHIVDHLGSKLNLSNDQKDKILEIFKEESPKMDAIREDTNSKLKSFWSGVHSRILLVLNGDQKKKFGEMMARWDARHNNPREWQIPGLPSGPVSGAPPPNQK